jgi:hypothetical protein
MKIAQTSYAKLYFPLSQDNNRNAGSLRPSKGKVLFITGTKAIVSSMSLRLFHSMFSINFTYIPLSPLCYVYRPITVIDSSDLI